MNIAKEIKTLREKLGLSQAECAKILDISPRKLWAWENGKPPSRIEQYGIIPLLESTKSETAMDRLRKRRSEARSDAMVRRHAAAGHTSNK